MTDTNSPEAQLVPKPGDEATPEQSGAVIAEGMTAIVGLLYTISPSEIARFNIKLAMMLTGLRPHMINASKAMRDQEKTDGQPGDSAPEESKPEVEGDSSKDAGGSKES